MNVLMLCTESPTRIWGGRGTWIRHAPLELTKRGVGIHLVTWETETKDLPYRWSIPRSTRVRVWPTDNDEQKILLTNQARLVRHCVEMWTRGHRWHVIHAHEWDMVLPALELRELFGTPVVTHYHLFQSQMAREVAGENKPNRDVDQHPCLAEHCGWVESDAVVVVSDNMRSWASEAWGNRDCDVVHNAVEFSSVKGDAVHRGPKPVILYCGRLAEQKGINHFLDAAMLEDRYQWVVMGKTAAMNTEDAERTPWMRRIRALEKLPQFRYVGHLEGKDRNDWFASADVVVMPSEHEPFGIVALEAQAAGAVLVHTNVNGLREFTSPDNSIECEPNGRSIIASVNRAIIEREESARLVRNAMENSKRYTWAGVADRIESVYSRVMNQTSLCGSTFTHVPARAACTEGKL